jgi:hypothetical protein
MYICEDACMFDISFLYPAKFLQVFGGEDFDGCVGMSSSLCKNINFWEL